LGYFSNSFDPSSFYGLEPEVYEHDGPIDHNGFYGYNGLCHGDNVDDELCGGGRDLHLSLDSGDDATGEDDQEVYILTMKVTDVYGASDNVSLLLLVRDERNDAPVANEHRLQPDWIIAYGDDNREVYVDADCDNLGGHDSDDDDLIYDWSYSGPDSINLDQFDSNYDHASGSGDILDATADLGVGEHTFTFTITDPYGASSSASTVFKILDEPASEPGNITITHTALKHTIIEVSENILPEFPEDCHGEVYNGADWNTGRLDLFRESGNDGSGERELIARWYDDDGDFSGELEHIDETLSAETDFTYTLETVNSDEDQDLVSLVSSSTRTHDRPEVEILTPNGAEIRSVGDNFDVDFITYFDRNNNDKYDEGIDDLTNGTYIAKIDVIYLADGLNEEEGVNSDGELQSSFNGFNKNGCSNSQFSAEEEQEISFDGDCSGYAEDTTFIDASSPEECQSIADSTSNANWAGFYCDAEEHCVQNGCYRSNDGTEIEWQDSCSDRDHDDDDSDDENDDEDDHPACVDDCVGIDSIDGENIDSFCAWFNGLTDCLDDCGGDEDVEMAASFCSCYSETMDEDLCSLMIDDCHAGDATLNYEISDNDGLEVNYDAKVRIRVHDVGDYNGNNSETHEDDSDSPFTMAAHTISKEYSAGWHLVGTPVVPFDDYLFDNFGESLGNWGEEWVTFDVTGAYDNLTLSLSEGYYLALADDNTLVQHGDPVIADPDCNDCNDNDFGLADIDLDKGWNLIANPLVNKVDKETFVVEYEGEELLFEDAVDAGWIAPTIYGWFENSYSPVDRIMPFGGYFVNTSRSLSMKVRPHLFDDGELTRKNDEMIASVIDIKARDISGLGVGDFISIGLLENASNEFVYGEDEYDLPRSAYSSMGGQYIDLKVGFDMIRDMKSLDYEDYQVWNVSITTEKINSDIELSWSDASSFNNNLYLVVNDQSINMNEQSSINISTSIDKISIVAGNINAFLNPVPVEFGLSSAYPNPFNPTTNMSLALNKEGFVSMSVYNVRGQVVEVLLDRNMQPGYHNVVWNADGFSSGMYFVKVENGSNTAIQKLMLLK